MTQAAPSIGDYGIIGDCHSAALISRDGALDWLCWPRFDSAAVFAGILDIDNGGRWEINPSGEYQTSRQYLEDTNVLEMRFQTNEGVVTLTDFMPLADKQYLGSHLTPDHAIARFVRCESGQVEMNSRFAPRPNFGKGKTKIIDRGKLGLRVSASHGMLALHSPVQWTIGDGVASSSISMKSGDETAFILTYSEGSPEVMPLLSDASASLQRTVDWWRKWSATNRYDGPYRHAVMRSVLALKLLEFSTSGAFVAAPTTSLPEKVGGKLNWDYRYCWLRDASFIIEALCGTGFVPEAEAFSEWLLHATRRTQPKLMVMYDMHGNQGPAETPIPYLAGYHGSVPVNIGNGARGQSQLDTYGEVVSGAAKLLKHIGKPADRETSKVLVGFGKYVCKHWEEPDAGIWEERGEPVVHTHSRLACWVALDSLIDLHDRQLIRRVPIEKFKGTREKIRQAIETESWNEAASTYTNEPGKLKLDATLLRMGILGFDKPSSQRMSDTFKCVCRELSAGGSLLYRNLPDDGKPNQGAFGICSFWRVQFMALGGGSLAEAEAAFTALLETANDLGLLGEETDPASGAVLGNFPQAFTHVGLIIAAMEIEKRRKKDISP